MSLPPDNCKRLRELIHLTVDRRVGLRQWLQVKWHVRRCSSCAREWAELRALGRTFGMLRTLRAPSDLAPSVRQRVAATRPAWTPVKRQGLPVTWQSLAGEALVAVVLVGLTTTWIARTDGWKPLATAAGAANRLVRRAPVPAEQQWAQIQEAARHDRQAWQRLVAETDRAVRSLGDCFMLPPAWPTWALWGLGGAILVLSLLLEAIPLKPFSIRRSERT